MASTADKMAGAAVKVEGRMFFRYRDDEGSTRSASVFDLLPLPLRRDVRLAPKPADRRRRPAAAARARHLQWKQVERPATVYLLWRDRGRAHIPLRHGSVYVIAPSRSLSPEAQEEAVLHEVDGFGGWVARDALQLPENDAKRRGAGKKGRPRVVLPFQTPSQVRQALANGWVGCPSTSLDLSFSGSANRGIINRQAWVQNYRPGASELALPEAPPPQPLDHSMQRTRPEHTGGSGDGHGAGEGEGGDGADTNGDTCLDPVGVDDWGTNATVLGLDMSVAPVRTSLPAAASGGVGGGRSLTLARRASAQTSRECVSATRASPRSRAELLEELHDRERTLLVEQRVKRELAEHRRAIGAARRLNASTAAPAHGVGDRDASSLSEAEAAQTRLRVGSRKPWTKSRISANKKLYEKPRVVHGWGLYKTVHNYDTWGGADPGRCYPTYWEEKYEFPSGFFGEKSVLKNDWCGR